MLLRQFFTLNFQLGVKGISREKVTKFVLRTLDVFNFEWESSSDSWIQGGVPCPEICDGFVVAEPQNFPSRHDAKF